MTIARGSVTLMACFIIFGLFACEEEEYSCDSSDDVTVLCDQLCDQKDSCPDYNGIPLADCQKNCRTGHRCITSPACESAEKELMSCYVGFSGVCDKLISIGGDDDPCKEQNDRSVQICTFGIECKTPYDQCDYSPGECAVSCDDNSRCKQNRETCASNQIAVCACTGNPSKASCGCM